MSNWFPEGSVPYDTSMTSGVFTTEAGSDGSVPYFSTVPYRAPKTRDARKCRGNANTCEGFKTGDTDFCSGHHKSFKKALDAAALVLAAKVAEDAAKAVERESVLALGFSL